MEEVFDQATLLTLRELMSKGELSELNGVVSAGKEARVYYGVAGKEGPRAVKTPHPDRGDGNTGS